MLHKTSLIFRVIYYVVKRYLRLQLNAFKDVAQRSYVYSTF